MKATCVIAWQSISLAHLGGSPRLRLPSGRSLELKSGDGF